MCTVLSRKTRQILIVIGTCEFYKDLVYTNFRMCLNIQTRLHVIQDWASMWEERSKQVTGKYFQIQKWDVKTITFKIGHFICYLNSKQHTNLIKSWKHIGYDQSSKNRSQWDTFARLSPTRSKVHLKCRSKGNLVQIT